MDAEAEFEGDCSCTSCTLARKTPVSLRSLQPVSTVEGNVVGTNNCQSHFKATLVVNGSISEGRWPIDVVAILA